MKFKLVSVVVWSVLVLLAATMACSNDGAANMGTPTTVPRESTPAAAESEGSTGGQASSIVFPQHDAPLGTDRGGRYFAGQIVITKGCLRAEAPTHNAVDPRESWLLIWPGAFTLEAESGLVRIIDGHGSVAASVGDHVRLSRAAETYQQAMEQGLLKGLSEDCGEPYLLVGDEVTAFDPENEGTELRALGPRCPVSKAGNHNGVPDPHAGARHGRAGPERPMPYVGRFDVNNLAGPGSHLTPTVAWFKSAMERVRS